MTPIKKEDDLKPVRKEYLTPLELSEKIGITQSGLKNWELQIKAFRPAKLGVRGGTRGRYSRRGVAIAHIIKDLRKDGVRTKAIDEFLRNGAIPRVFIKMILEGLEVKQLIQYYERYMEES